ncbi:MAG TPA: hypothetical protein VMU37_00055 [Caulobacteraceae bacterium]|nr:hypothetical protein [Caulobacteraceae bacterium]
MKAKKPKRRGLADMDFGEGLARLIQTKPGEVTPASGKKRKIAKAAKRVASLGKERQEPKDQQRRRDT